MTGCNQVYRTSALTPYAVQGNEKFCSNSTGVYALPMGEIDFKVTRKDINKGQQYRYELEFSNTNAPFPFIADNNHIYCLDHITNGFAQDVIGVTRNEHQLLTKVYSRVDDQSDDVIKKIVQGGAELAAGQRARSGRNFTNDQGTTTKILEFQFDVFNYKRLRQVNKALKFTGHCLYIDPLNDPHVPKWMNAQCGGKHHTTAAPVKSSNEEAFDNSEYTAGDGRFGVLYKPLLPHTLVIMKRDDPTSGDPWRTWKRQIVHLPNRSPPFLLEVKRTLFNTRKTELTFDRGVLEEVSIQKRSAALAASELLVSVVGIIVEIPARALTIGLNDAQQNESLIQANTALIDAVAKLRTQQETSRANAAQAAAAKQNSVLALQPDLPNAAQNSREARDLLSLQACIANAPGNRSEAEEFCLKERNADQ